MGSAPVFFGIYVFNAWSEPNVLATGIVAWDRVWAITLAAALTTFGTLALKASQPAALATTLLVSLGAMHTRLGCRRYRGRCSRDGFDRGAGPAVPAEAYETALRARGIAITDLCRCESESVYELREITTEESPERGFSDRGLPDDN